MESVIYRSHNTDKSSTTGGRGRVGCPYSTDVLRKFQSVSAWFNFKLKREQEIAVKSISVNESRLGCLVADRLHMGRVKYYKVYVIASGQRNNTEGFARLPPSSKTRLPKQDHLESSACPCYRHIH